MEYLPIIVLGLEKSLDALLLLYAQHDKGLLMGLVEGGEDLDDLGDRQ